MLKGTIAFLVGSVLVLGYMTRVVTFALVLMIMVCMGLIPMGMRV